MDCLYLCIFLQIGLVFFVLIQQPPPNHLKLCLYVCMYVSLELLWTGAPYRQPRSWNSTHSLRFCYEDGRPRTARIEICNVNLGNGRPRTAEGYLSENIHTYTQRGEERETRIMDEFSLHSFKLPLLHAIAIGGMACLVVCRRWYNQGRAHVSEKIDQKERGCTAQLGNRRCKFFFIIVVVVGGGGWRKQVQCATQRDIWTRSLFSFRNCSLFSHVNVELDRLWHGKDDDSDVGPILDCIYHLREKSSSSISTQEVVSLLSKLRKNKSFDQFEEAQAMKIWNTLQVRSVIPR